MYDLDDTWFDDIDRNGSKSVCRHAFPFVELISMPLRKVDQMFSAYHEEFNLYRLIYRQSVFMLPWADTVLCEMLFYLVLCTEIVDQSLSTLFLLIAP